ncbi:hypothetical protein ACFL2T_05180 [Elusimicrobiota bacterium]
MKDELKFKSEEERHAYAMRKAIERVEKLDPTVVEKCDKDRLLKDFQREILMTLPRVTRDIEEKL